MRTAADVHIPEQIRDPFNPGQGHHYGRPNWAGPGRRPSPVGNPLRYAPPNPMLAGLGAVIVDASFGAPNIVTTPLNTPMPGIVETANAQLADQRAAQQTWLDSLHCWVTDHPVLASGGLVGLWALLNSGGKK